MSDRSNWTVRKVSLAEADRLDDKYYASLSYTDRLELLMDLRSAIEADDHKLKPVVVKRHLHETEEI